MDHVILLILTLTHGLIVSLASPQYIPSFIFLNSLLYLPALRNPINLSHFTSIKPINELIPSSVDILIRIIINLLLFWEELASL